MSMTKTEAVRVDYVLRWLSGDPATDAVTCYYQAGRLAERVRAVFPGGVTPEQVFTATAVADRPAAAHTLLAELLAQCWEAEGEAGFWASQRVMDILVLCLTEAGFDTTHPAVRQGGNRKDWTATGLRAYAMQHARQPDTEPGATVTHAAAPSAERGNPE